MKSTNNISKANHTISASRKSKTEMIKDISDADNVEATRENVFHNTDTVGIKPSDIYDVINGKHPNNEEHIKKQEDEDNPLISGI